MVDALVKPARRGLDLGNGKIRARFSGQIPWARQEPFSRYLRLFTGRSRAYGAFSVTRKVATRNRSRLAATLAAGALVLAGLPTAVFAVGADDETTFGTLGSFAALTPASVDPRLARFGAARNNDDARLMRFTPAGVADRGSRSVTVAVRIDEEAARAISVRSAIAAAMEQVAGEGGVRITPTRYSLGLSRGYQSFAKPEPVRLSRSLSDAAIPDLADFEPSPGASEGESRFAPRVELEQEAKTGSTPRTIDSRSDQTVGLGGSYRLTRNLDVSAGVRYSQERDRLAPLADSTKQDSQAVYVGTQFRF